jgi:hypothetical protein
MMWKEAVVVLLGKMSRNLLAEVEAIHTTQDIGRFGRDYNGATFWLLPFEAALLYVKV